MRLWWRYHKVQPGDTLASLARSYRVTASSIAGVNQLDGTELQANAELIIPIAPGKHPVSDTMPPTPAGSRATKFTRETRSKP